MMTFEQCYEAARRIVAAEKALWPGCEGALGSGGGSRGSGSTAYSRTGTGTHEQYRTVPAYMRDLIMQNTQTATTDPALAQAQKATFTSLMSKTPADVPGYSKFQTVINQPSTGFTGETALSTIAARSPYSGDFEQDTQAAYAQRAADAMAQVATGPDAVRGGVNRTSLLQGELADRLAAGRGMEVRQAQNQEVGDVLRAVTASNAIQQGLRGESMQAANMLSSLVGAQDERALAAGRAVDANKLNNLSLLGLAAGLEGTTVDKQTDNYSGMGDQSASQMQAGFNLCCFTFLEALNGELPWFVELARVEFWTPRRRNGYTWMSNWLVPAMRRSKVVRWLVNALMVRPLTKYGAWLYGEEKAKAVWRAYSPVVTGWFTLWSLIGRLTGDVNYGKNR